MASFCTSYVWSMRSAGHGPQRASRAGKGKYMKTLAYFSFLLFSSAVAVPVGGSISLLLSFSFRIPYIGHTLGFVLHDIARVTAPVKLVSWLVSASGLIVGFLLCQSRLGPPDTPYQWWAVVIMAGGVMSHLSWRIISFELFDIAYITRTTSKFATAAMLKQFQHAKPQDLAMLLRQNFAELTFIPILRLFAAFGLLIFALANLGFLPTTSSLRPTLQQCLATSLSIASLAPADSIIFSGPLWLALRVIMGVVLLVWAVAFVSFAIDALPKPSESRLALGLAEPSEDPANVPAEDKS